MVSANCDCDKTSWGGATTIKERKGMSLLFVMTTKCNRQDKKQWRYAIECRVL